MKPRWTRTLSGNPGICSAAIWLLFPGALSVVRAQVSEDWEYGVKLSFLYHFAQFVEWPSDAFHGASDPFTICVAGTDPFAPEMVRDLRNRTVRGRPIDVRNLQPHDDPRTCHVLFIRSDESKRLAGLLAAVRTSSTLTVGELEGFAELGGAINLARAAHTLRLEVNLEAAVQSRLQISSRLLALAKIVTTGQRP